MRRKELRVLLIQIREDTQIKQEEHFQFLKRSGLNPMQLVVWDVFEVTEPPYRPIDFDCILIGGSSDDPEDEPYFSPVDHPFITHLLRFINSSVEHAVPILAVCMGFEVLVQALGGEIIVDVPNKEAGTVPITLTDAGRDDPVLRHLPHTFPAISWHIKQALSLPAGAVILATSTMCTHQAFRLEYRPVYAFQFHPELTKYDLFSRLLRYHEHYGLASGSFDDLEGQLDDTDDANTIIEHFLNQIVCGGMCQ